MKKSIKNNNKAGFTLIELLIAMTITAIVMASLIAVFSAQQESYAVESEKAKHQSHARSALYMMARDIKMAGYTGMALGGANLASTGQAMPLIWIKDGSSVLSATSVDPALTAAAEGDVIEVWGNFRREVSNLTVSAAPGNGSITIDNPGAFSGNGINRPGYVLIGNPRAGGEFEVELHTLTGYPAAGSTATGVLQLGGVLTNTYVANEALVAPYYRRIYYVSPNRLSPGLPGPTLAMRNCQNGPCSLGGSTVETEMAPGVSEIQFSYDLENAAGQFQVQSGSFCDPCDVRGVNITLTTVTDWMREDNPIIREHGTSVKVRNIGLDPNLNDCPLSPCP